MMLTKEMIEQHKKDCSIFIETGTFFGDAVNLAKTFNFDEIHTVELSRELYERNVANFTNDKNVFCHRGDSIQVLPQILQNINKKCLFWLDGHYSGGVTAKGEKSCPLEEELMAIAQHHIKDHTILIDDINQCGTEWLIDYDIIVKRVLEINPNYTIKVVDSEHWYEGRPMQYMVVSI